MPVEQKYRFLENRSLFHRQGKKHSMYQFKSKTLTCTVCASEQFLSATHHGATVQKAPSASDHFLSKTNVQFTLSGRVLTTLAETEALTILTKSKANFPQIFLLFFLSWI